MTKHKYTITGAFAHPVCEDPIIYSQNVIYSGPNLPCTGILTCDDLNTVVQKIDEQLCVLIQAIYDLNNPI